MKSKKKRCGPVPVIVAVFAFTFLPSPVVHAQDQQATASDTTSQTVRVVNVSRGDVLRVENGGPERVVMLYGVTCPDPTTPVGAQAKEFTKDRIADQTVPMTVRYRQPSVEYIEIQLADGTILNEELLLAGLGKLDTVSAAGDDAYAALQEQARVDEVGVWRSNEEAAQDESVETRVIAIEDPSESAVDRYKRVKELQREVEFAVAVDHWRELTAADKSAIETSIQQRAQTRTARAEEDLQAVTEEFDAVSREIDELEAQIEAKEEELNELSPLAEDQAVLDLYAQDPELVRLESSLSDARSATEIAVRDYGGSSTTYYRTMEDEEIAEQLVAERRQLLAAEERNLRTQFERQRELIEQELAVLERGYSSLLNDYNAVETDYTRAAAGVDTREATADTRLTTLQELEQAAATGFNPGLTTQQIGIWRGQGPSETPAFDVTQDVWVIDYDAGDAAGQRQLQITLLRESDNGVVRQIVDNTLAHQSFTTLTDQGGMYLRISAPDDVSWSITATGYAAK